MGSSPWDDIEHAEYVWVEVFEMQLLLSGTNIRKASLRRKSAVVQVQQMFHKTLWSTLS